MKKNYNNLIIINLCRNYLTPLCTGSGKAAPAKNVTDFFLSEIGRKYFPNPSTWDWNIAVRSI